MPYHFPLQSFKETNKYNTDLNCTNIVKTCIEVAANSRFAFPELMENMRDSSFVLVV